MLTSLAFIFLVGLAMGAICQKLKLPARSFWSVAVLAIIITAPIGAIGIDCSYKTLLEKN